MPEHPNPAVQQAANHISLPAFRRVNTRPKDTCRMCAARSAASLAERYDVALHTSRHAHLPHDAPRPLPTRYWPRGNLELLAHYRRWLVEGGTSERVTAIYHIPMAGHVLGLALKPYFEIDLDQDLERALQYVRAKGLSAQWIRNCRNSLRVFRRFLQIQNGLPEDMRPATVDLTAYVRGLPVWLVKELEHYQQWMQRNWRPTRVETSLRSFWSKQAGLWRFLCEVRGLTQLAQLEQRHVLEYVDLRIRNGLSAQTINAELSLFRTFLVFLQDKGYEVPRPLLRVPSLRAPDALPRYLTDTQVRQVRDELEQSVQTATLSRKRRLALLHRAAFHLLWQCGLRLGELQGLQLEDLDLAEKRLLVRDSKNRRDRTVYLADAALQALQEYLAVRGKGGSNHVFLYHNLPVSKDLIRHRLKEVGRHAGVNVYPHRLRHTCATQLLNAGCPVTTIQRFLGHKRLTTTMIYARAYDRAVAQDYFVAMRQIESSMDIVPAGQGAASQPRGVAKMQAAPMNGRLIAHVGN